MFHHHLCQVHLYHPLKRKNRDPSSSPKKNKNNQEKEEDGSSTSSSTEQKTPKKKSPKKIKRTPVDQSKPLPTPGDGQFERDNVDEQAIDHSPMPGSVSVPDLSPPKPNMIMNSPSMGFVSSPKLPPSNIPGLHSAELLVAPKEQYNLFISQHPPNMPNRPDSPAHPYFMQDENAVKII